MSNLQVTIHFFMQMAFILVVCRLVGLVARRIGQPPVMAEMIAGILMGPSLFGLLAPAWQAQVFPSSSLQLIYVVSQVGLVLYMFLIGLEFDLDLIRSRLRSAITVSGAGIVVPFALGALVARLLLTDQKFFGADVTRWEGMIYMGASMSITAFPMLARIIHERGLAGTSLGTLALAAASLDDAAAWCLLAIVLASFQTNPTIPLMAIGGGIVYAIAVFAARKPFLSRLSRIAESKKEITGGMLSFVLTVLMLCAAFTDAVGIYAVFGAFVLGCAMPKGFFSQELRRLLEPLTTGFLLPLFFVYSGLNTRIGLIVTPSLLPIAILIVLIACLGKGGGCWLAARLNGEPQREASAIGVLMNTRGMMELIILNIGLERGIITPILFTIMVMMAIITTMMTSPLFEWVYRRTSRFAPAVEPAGFVPDAD